MDIKRLVAGVVGVVAFAALAPADTLVLKDGSVLVGVVKQQSNGYEIVSADGRSRFVPKSEVKSIKLSNDGKVTEQSAKERLASLRRSVDAESQIDRILERYRQFIEMNKETDAAQEALKDIALWEQRKQQGMVKVGNKWMTPTERNAYLVNTAKAANEIADQIAAGDIATATKRIAQGLEDDPNNLSLAYLDGVLQLRRGRYNEAKRSFDIVMEQIPDHPPTLYNEAAIAAYFKRWPVAIPMFEKVMTLAPNHPEILNGVTEFLRLLPDSNKRSAAFDRFFAIYSAQEQIVSAEMAKKGLYRFGSTWAPQDKIDEMKKKLAEFEEKKKAMQEQIDASTEKMRQLDAAIQSAERQLEEIERQRIQFDPTTNRTVYLPRPSYYYKLVEDRDQDIRELRAEKSRNDDLRRQAKDLDGQAPQPPYSGQVQPINEAGVPIVMPASTQTDAAPPPAAGNAATTQSASDRAPLPFWPPADSATTQPTP